MKKLIDFKEEIHKCSKCGLCQAECPIYKITGNDCSVSRGFFSMLQGVLNKDIPFSNKINRYLDLCLKCNACSKSCPSGIDITNIIASAKSIYFKKSCLEKIKSFFQKYFLFGLLPNTINFFRKKYKSKTFHDKVLYFGGCQSKINTTKGIIKILNKAEIEVITPNFQCCGIPYFSRGDLEEFDNSIENFIKTLKKYNIKNIITTCASCEKTLNNYIKWADEQDTEFLKEIKIKNIYNYIREKNIILNLKKEFCVTFHKPCNIDNYNDIEWILKNTKNLKYNKMSKFDSCCGLNGLFKFNDYKIIKKIFDSKFKNIINSKAKIVLTTCFGCELALKTYSLGKYKTEDLIIFLSNHT